MPLSHNHKCLFVHIPRTGGTSFRRMLKIDEEVDGIEYLNTKGLMPVQNQRIHLPSHTIPRVLHKEHLCIKYMSQLNLIDQDIFDNYYKFAFVRNPWDKAVSEYMNHYHIYCSDFEHYVSKVKVIVEYLNENFTFDLETPFYEDYSRITFNALHNKDLDYPFKPWPGEEVVIDPHFFPQHLFTHDENGNLLVNTIGVFEDFDNNAADILDHLGVDHSHIVKINSSNRGTYQDMHTEKTKDIIARVYDVDIKMFGYEF